MSVEEQGVNFDRYMLVPRTLIFLTRGDEVLLLKGAKNKRLWSGLYNGIGGHIEKGEDVFDAAQREIIEETGISSQLLSLCGIVTVDSGINPGVCIFIFKGECLLGKVSGSAEGSLEWIARSELFHLPLVADLHELLPRILSHPPGSQPFTAHSVYDENGRLTITFH